MCTSLLRVPSLSRTASSVKKLLTEGRWFIDRFVSNECDEIISHCRKNT